MKTDLPAEYDLFLDESGTFMETSTVPAERTEALKQNRPFPSQLAGLLAPRGKLTEGTAKQVRNRALGVVGLTSQPVHGTELLRSLGKERYNRFVTELVAGVQRRSWQPVRLVNRERLSYGDRVATYTNLVAELVLRICQQKLKEGQPQVWLRLYCARVKLGETPNGALELLDRKEYERRIREYLGFAAVRRGLAHEAALWRVEDFHIRSGKDDPELHLCDVISHATHDEFRPCEPATAEVVRAAFGAWDFTLVMRELLDRVDQHLVDGALALAIIALAERLIQGELEPDLEQGARRRLQDVVECLARHSGPARDPHLNILVSWLEQIIELERSSELGYKLAQWLLCEVEHPIRSRLGDGAAGKGLDWFSYALHTWALTASNHLGALGDARNEAETLEGLIPKLAGQWEHATLLMRGLVAEGVHRTDCFEYDAVCSRMRIVADYYGQMGELFNAALPAIFPTRVRSNLCGRALGTWLQSEIFAGMYDPQRLKDARRLSERAIDEFPAEEDKERQYQYRSQLETAAGCFDEARNYLARSLRIKDASHASLANAITSLGSQIPMVQGFALLHWLRLGVTATLSAAGEESTNFLNSVVSSGLLDGMWCQGKPTDYPVHGILRRVAVIRAARGEASLAASALTRLGEILDGNPTELVVLQAIRLAAHAEVASVLTQQKQVRRCLDNSAPGEPGLLQLVEAMAARTREALPSVWRMFERWPLVVGQALTGNSAAAGRAELLQLARLIGY